MKPTDRARAYLAKLPPAISGQGGHAATFNAACRLVEFGLSFEEAFPVLADWNQTHCQPPWTEKELRHKLADAFKKTRTRYHFAAAKTRTASPTAAFVSEANRQSSRKTVIASAQVEKQRAHLRYEPLCQSGQVAEMGGKASPGRQLATPKLALAAGTASDFRWLAILRGISEDAVALASQRGLLRFGEYRHRPAWFILDASGRVAQARRLDGHTWFADVKALNLRGSQAAWPVGIHEAAPFPILALCEGGPDLLAAFHFILREHRQHNCTPVAMLGGSHLIHPDALPLFVGKRVRIFPHLDDTGTRAVDRWAGQLAPIGADVDAFSFAGLRRADGQAVKDLNDFARAEVGDENQTLTKILLP